MRKVKDIMTSSVIKVHRDTPIRDIAAAMYENDLTGVPVMKGSEVVGIITEADLVAKEANIHMPQFIQILDGALYLDNPKKVEEELEKIRARYAEEIMTKDVVTVQEESDVHELATLMVDRHVNPVPVVNGKNELTGIVSRADLVKLIAEDKA